MKHKRRLRETAAESPACDEQLDELTPDYKWMVVTGGHWESGVLGKPKWAQSKTPAPGSQKEGYEYLYLVRRTLPRHLGRSDVLQVVPPA